MSKKESGENNVCTTNVMFQYSEHKLRNTEVMFLIQDKLAKYRENILDNLSFDLEQLNTSLTAKVD